MVRFVWYNIILSRVLNWFVAPIAYLLRDRVNRGFLWWFLTDNTYGDKNWKPKLKNKFLRAVLWMYRNPLQNYYWKDYVEGKETQYKGTLKYKYRSAMTMWRTMVCVDTKDNHGKILDFKNSLFGVQDITFKRTDKKGNVQNCYRKSTCVPYRILWWIVLVKRRSGHEKGIMQHNFSFPKYKYKNHKKEWKEWKKTKWKTITV